MNPVATETADVLAILKLMARLAQAADDRDEAAYRACLANSVVDWPQDGGGLPVPGDVYAKASIARVSGMDWTHHKLVNPIVDVDGDRAAARIDVVVDMSCKDETGVPRRASIGGRYDLGFVRIHGEWRIDRRIMHRRYVIGDAEVSAMPAPSPAP